MKKHVSQFGAFGSITVNLVVSLALLLTPTIASGEPYRMNFTDLSYSPWSSFGGYSYLRLPNAIRGNGTQLPAGQELGFEFSTGSDEVVIAGVDITMHRSGLGIDVPTFITTDNKTFIPNVVQDGSNHLSMPKLLGSSFRIGIRPQKTITLNSNNEFVINNVKVDLTDTVRPQFTTLLSSPGDWTHESYCVPIVATVTDKGFGVKRIYLINKDTSATLAIADSQIEEGKIRRGQDLLNFHSCINMAERIHGESKYSITGEDVSGNTIVHNFTVKTDKVAPKISTSLQDNATFEAPFSIPHFNVIDDDSGIKEIDTKINDTDVSHSRLDEGGYSLQKSALTPGQYAITYSAKDKVGNLSTIARNIRVVDTTPPTIGWHAPLENGEATTTLRVSASDLISGINPNSWKLEVNGKSLSLDGSNTSASATIGPLPTGTHNLVVSVEDNAGNSASISKTYTVNPSPSLGSDVAQNISNIVSEQNSQSKLGIPIGASGKSSAFITASNTDNLQAWIVGWPSKPIAFGKPATLVVFVARSGTPIQGLRVSIKRSGAEIARSTTGSDGTASITLLLTDPVKHEVIVDGLPSMPITAKLMPRIILQPLPQKLKPNSTIKLRGRLVPAYATSTVLLEAKRGNGGWFLVRKIPSTKSGKFSATIKANSSGKFQLRLRSSPNKGWVSSESNTRKLNIS